MNERDMELAEECTNYTFTGGNGVFKTFDKEKFAALIRADEREACAKVCENFTRTPETNGLELTLSATAIRARGNT